MYYTYIFLPHLIYKDFSSFNDAIFLNNVHPLLRLVHKLIEEKFEFEVSPPL